MIYKVIDKLRCEEREYNNVLEAYKDAFDHQCILLEVNLNGLERILEDFS